MLPGSEDYMRQAIALAVDNVAKGGGPFGALVVKAGQVIATGVNQVTATNDPTAHAEVTAIRGACRELNTFQLDGCELYCSCEPCPMCLGAIYWARPERFYFAATRQSAAAAGFDDAFIYDEMKLFPERRAIRGVLLLAEEGRAAFEEWERCVGKALY
ncbi:MAG TPA: tRNA-specific adenosine deaminase [Solibacterales bacterium]|nr:tRNA-specific adenosine deaminase [Bryobacterales bacterium]